MTTLDGQNSEGYNQDAMNIMMAKGMLPHPGRESMYKMRHPGVEKLGGNTQRSDKKQSNTVIAQHYLMYPLPHDQHLLMPKDDIIFLYKRIITTPDLVLQQKTFDPPQMLLPLSFLNNDVLKKGYIENKRIWRNFWLDHLDIVNETNWTPPKFPSEKLISQKIVERKQFDNLKMFSTGNTPSYASMKTKYYQNEGDLINKYQNEFNVANNEIISYYDKKVASINRKLVEFDNGIDLFFQYYNDFSETTGLGFLTQMGILDKFIYLGVLNNTDNDAGNLSERTRDTLPIANVNFEGPTKCLNFWSSDVKTGAHLYLVLRRKNIGNNEYSHFEIVPWYSNERLKPPPKVLRYIDLGGEECFGHFWFIGTANRQASDSDVSEEARSIAAGLFDVTHKSVQDITTLKAKLMRFEIILNK